MHSIEFVVTFLVNLMQFAQQETTERHTQREGEGEAREIEGVDSKQTCDIVSHSCCTSALTSALEKGRQLSQQATLRVAQSPHLLIIHTQVPSCLVC